MQSIKGELRKVNSNIMVLNDIADPVDASDATEKPELHTHVLEFIKSRSRTTANSHEEMYPERN